MALSWLWGLWKQKTSLATERVSVRVTLVQGDLAQQDVCAIVNAADETLLGGTGVDGAIRRVAGPELTQFCRKIAPCRTGEVKVSPGFKLKARYVLHAVAPIWLDGGGRRLVKANADLLKGCFVEAIREAEKLGCRSIGIPALGAGAFGWDVEDVAELAADACRDVSRHSRGLQEIRFVAFGPRAMRAFEAALGVAGRIDVPVERLSYDPGQTLDDFREGF